MGTVPSPVLPTSGSAAVVSQPTSWVNTMNFMLQPPSCRVHLTTAVTGWAVATAPVVWNAEDWDIVQSGDTEMHSTTTNQERITIRTAGRYRVHGMVAMSTTTALQVQAMVYKNTSATGIDMWVGMTTGTAYTPAFSDEIQCAIGDYLTLQISPTATGLTVNGTIDVHMVVTWVSN